MSIYLINQSNFRFDQIVLGFFKKEEKAEKWMHEKREELENTDYRKIVGDDHGLTVHTRTDAITYWIEEVTEGVE